MTTRLRMVGTLLTALLACAASPFAWRQSNGAVIAGTIVDDLGQPVPRAGVAVLDHQNRPVRSFPTDGAGRFEFVELPMGAYTVSAWKAGYVTSAFGQRRARPFGTVFEMHPGDRRTVSIRLKRGGIIVGHVRDEEGADVPGALILLHPVILRDGVRELDALHGQDARTNSRGEYRAAGLADGDYVLGVAPLSEQPQELRRNDAHGRGSVVRDVMTYYPNALDADEADIIRVQAGETRSDIDLRMRRVRVGRIDATIVNPLPGNLDDVVAVVDPNRRNAVEPSPPYPPQAPIAGPEGIVVVPALPFGPHTLMVSGTVTFPEPRAPIRVAATAEFVAGEQPVAITLALQPLARMTVRHIFKGDAAAVGDNGQYLTIALQPVGASPIGSAISPTEHDAARTTFTGLFPDQYWLHVTPPPGWVLRSAMTGNRDVGDTPIDLSNVDTITNVIATYVSAGPVLAGTVADADGHATFDASIVIVPADRRQWRVGSPRMRVAAPAADGCFTIRGLPAGEYAIVAVRDDVEAADLEPAVLERLLAGASRVTLVEGGTATVALRIR